jgi:hypothetical protein
VGLNAVEDPIPHLIADGHDAPKEDAGVETAFEREEPRVLASPKPEPKAVG